MKGTDHSESLLHTGEPLGEKKKQTSLNSSTDLVYLCMFLPGKNLNIIQSLSVSHFCEL